MRVLKSLSDFELTVNRTGHLLLLSSLNEPTTLVPPLRGPQDVSTVLKWAKDHPDRVVFQPRSFLLFIVKLLLTVE